MYIFIIAGALVLSLILFYGFSLGFHEGIKFATKIAAHLGIKKNLFLAILENGVDGGQSLALLGALSKSGYSIEQASIELSPSLLRGVVKMEEKFGAQLEIEQIKPIINDLYSKWISSQ